MQWYQGDFEFDNWKKSIDIHFLDELIFLISKYKNNYFFSDLLLNSSIFQFLQEIKTNLLDNYPGFAIISLSTEQLANTDRYEISKILSLCIGDFVPQQYQHKTFIREIKDRGLTMPEGGRYSDTNQGGSFHNDGSPYPLPLPDYNLLYCITQAPQGGELLILSIESVYCFLKQHHPKILEILFNKFHFDRRGDIGPNGEKTVEKPIFYYEQNKICMSYLRDYIEAGHKYKNIRSLKINEIKALDLLDSVLNDPHFSIKGRLKPDEIIILNNKRTLHSRTAFVDDPLLPRLMLRTWVNTRSIK